MDVQRSTYEEEETCVQSLVSKPEETRPLWGTRRMIILKRII
jgi:hypothetical protein